MKKCTNYRKILGMITNEQVWALEQAAIRIYNSRLFNNNVWGY